MAKTNPDELNYELTIHAHNGASADFEFHADSAELASAHVAQLLRDENMDKSWDWKREADAVRFMCFRKKGLVRWKTYFRKPKPPTLKERLLKECAASSQAINRAYDLLIQANADANVDIDKHMEMVALFDRLGILKHIRSLEQSIEENL